MTEFLHISGFAPIVHDEGSADLMKLLKRLANKRSADWLRADATGLLNAGASSAFGMSRE